ncbi:MAG: CsbD family protein [Bacteroidetes bacterium]|nr:CsbD family protein [Bacteroidota bacterium]
MTNLEFKGDWNITKGKVKQKFGILTDRDVVLVEGKYDEMLGKLQLILGRTKDELHKIITEL